MNKFEFFVVLPLFALLFSCSARIDGVVREGGAADITIKTSLEPRTQALIRSIKGFLGEALDEPALDGAAISRSMASAPGVKAVSLKNTGPSSLEGTVSLSNVGDFLVSNNAKHQFISYSGGQPPGNSSIIITLERDSAPELIARLSPEVEEYLSALMAPVVLGEDSTRQEYVSLLTAVYGRSLADEIAAARLRVFIEFPRNIAKIQGGDARGKLAEFNIPLLDLMVLEDPLRYEVFW